MKLFCSRKHLLLLFCSIFFIITVTACNQPSVSTRQGNVQFCEIPGTSFQVLACKYTDGTDSHLLDEYQYKAAIGELFRDYDDTIGNCALLDETTTDAPGYGVTRTFRLWQCGDQLVVSDVGKKLLFPYGQPNFTYDGFTISIDTNLPQGQRLKVTKS